MPEHDRQRLVEPGPDQPSLSRQVPCSWTLVQLTRLHRAVPVQGRNTNEQAREVRSLVKTKETFAFSRNSAMPFHFHEKNSSTTFLILFKIK